MTARDPTPWEVGLIRRMDSAILAIGTRPGQGGDEIRNEVAMDDVRGLKSLLSGFKLS